MIISEFYLKKPVIFDYVISFVVIYCFKLALKHNLIKLPTFNHSINVLTDISNLSFTSTGFVLTILTVLITFKAGSTKKEKVKDYDSALDLFFQTPLYKTTTTLLKNCIKSLVFLAVLGYLLKAALSNENVEYLFYFSVFGLVVLSLTLIRCMVILSKILKLQNK